MYYFTRICIKLNYTNYHYIIYACTERNNFAFVVCVAFNRQYFKLVAARTNNKSIVFHTNNNSNKF